MAVDIAIGREASIASVRSREGGISDTAAARVLDEMVDLAVTIPKVDIRRVGNLLRRYLGPAEAVVKRAFGDDAINGLVVAATHRPLGIPRFLERLAGRVMLLADYTLEARAMRELSEAQWAWVVLSARWPEFRRFMIRGGKDRWMLLKVAIGQLGADGSGGGDADILQWLRQDPLLADYLRQHADGLDRDNMGVYWVEDMLLQAGL
jgi:hypothetical protein